MNNRFIIIHHSATKDGKTYNWNAIRKYHKQILGWRDIGYHFGIDDIDGQYEIIFGRMPNERGAHCRHLGMNALGIGVCVVGNFDSEVPSMGKINKALDLCKWLMEVYDIKYYDVLGHREVQEKANVPEDKRKTCPGKLFNMKRFREQLKERIQCR